MSTDAPTSAEIRHAIKEFMAGKAAGPGGILGKALEINTGALLSCRTTFSLLRNLLTSGKRSMVSTSQKGRGDFVKFTTNYRKMKPLSVPGKAILTRIIFERFKRAIAIQLQYQQAEFRKSAHQALTRVEFSNTH